MASTAAAASMCGCFCFLAFAFLGLVHLGELVAMISEPVASGLIRQRLRQFGHRRIHGSLDFIGSGFVRGRLLEPRPISSSMASGHGSPFS